MIRIKESRKGQRNQGTRKEEGERELDRQVRGNMNSNRTPNFKVGF